MAAMWWCSALHRHHQVRHTTTPGTGLRRSLELAAGMSIRIACHFSPGTARQHPASGEMASGMGITMSRPG